MLSAGDPRCGVYAPLPRPLVYEVPVLKQYYYARLPHRVLIIDPMKQKIAAILPM